VAGHTCWRGCGAGADGVAETVAGGGDRGGWCGDGGQGRGRRRGSRARRQRRTRGHTDPGADCTAETTARVGAAAGAETVVGVGANGADPGNNREGRGVDGARGGDDGRGGARIRERTTRRKRQRPGRMTAETVVGAGAVGARGDDWAGSGRTACVEAPGLERTVARDPRSAGNGRAGRGYGGRWRWRGRRWRRDVRGQ
jgi:hypothetical protein